MQATLPPAAADDARRATETRSHSRPPITSYEMEAILCEEVNGAVFEYSQLCEEFLVVDNTRADKIMGKLTESSHLRYDGQWRIDCTQFEGPESKSMHQAWAKVLDAIMVAAFEPNASAHPFRPKAQTIEPNREGRLHGDHPDDTNTSPDLVQGYRNSENQLHWGDLEFFGECKAKSDALDDAMMQIARYSRAIFTHQIYRRYIFSLALCGTWATFVRVTRNGIIHSPPMDVKTDTERFIRSVAGLFSLDDFQFGYDTRFYYWPPLSAEENDQKKRQLRVKTQKWRWIVVELLCHRMCLVGRATVVMLLCRVGHPQQRAVLKSIWRPKSRPDEGESLLKFKDRAGVCQLRWSECLGGTHVSNRSQLIPSTCQRKFMVISPEEKQEILDSVPTTNSKNTRAAQGKLNYMKSQLRLEEPPEDRVHSLILMDEGARAWRIKRLGHLARVLRDAIVGYAWVVRENSIHRDISEGNILCKLPSADDPWENEMTNAEDLDGEEATEESFVLSRISYEFENITLEPEHKIEGNPTIEQYVKERYARQQPLGQLCDFEFSVEEERPENEVRTNTDRTGTPAFISVQLLLATPEKPVRHTFLHDLESFFWVFVWLIVTRAAVDNQGRNAALRLLKLFSVNGDTSTARSKKLFIFDEDDINSMNMDVIEKMDKDWRSAASVIGEFVGFLKNNLYTSGSRSGAKLTWDEKWAIIKTLIDMFDNLILQE
ncbi:RNA-directed RNA polymerase L [Rhizoctonia solani]|uniref:RNA-directed RNA polymerase L n=1 Tax=Rhizoctonia solani TaxID=456999 RepID=A0A0K6G7Z1_9AGAM|nr:RNA-directed RNA polymerase L [Rhizoctonia solani]